MTTLSKEKQQEQLSRAALADCLTRFGWVVDRVDVDIGEDLLVRVMDGERFSGITFFVQLKSRTSLAASARKKGRYGQRIRTKHLLHWEGFGVPVVLVVWDIAKSEGYWVTIDDALRKLRATRRTLSGTGTISVPVPLRQTTSTEGLNELRRELAHLCLPSVQKGRSLGMSMAFKFPRTQRGMRQQRALEEALRKGTTAKIDGAFITKFEHTGWSRRLFGTTDLPAQIEIKSTPDTKAQPVAVRLELVGSAGDVRAALPYIELRVKRAGTDEITLSSEQQGHCLVLSMTIPRPPAAKTSRSKAKALPRPKASSGRVAFKIRSTPAPATDVYNALAFGVATASSSLLRIVFLRGGQVQRLHVGSARAVSRTVFVAVGALVEVQGRLQGHSIMLPHGPRLSRDDIRAINAAHDAIVVGRSSRTSDVSVPMKRRGVEQLLTQAAGPETKHFGIEVVRRPSELKIFNLRVRLEETRTTFGSALDCARAIELRSALTRSRAATVPVRLAGMTVEEVYGRVVAVEPRSSRDTA